MENACIIIIKSCNRDTICLQSQTFFCHSSLANITKITVSSHCFNSQSIVKINKLIILSEIVFEHYNITVYCRVICTTRQWFQTIFSKKISKFLERILFLCRFKFLGLKRCLTLVLSTTVSIRKGLGLFQGWCTIYQVSSYVTKNTTMIPIPLLQLMV